MPPPSRPIISTTPVLEGLWSSLTPPKVADGLSTSRPLKRAGADTLSALEGVLKKMRILGPPVVITTPAAKASTVPVMTAAGPSSSVAPAVSGAPTSVPRGVTILDPTEVGEFVKDPPAEGGADSSADTSSVPDFSLPLSSRDNRARLVLDNVRSDVESALWRDLDQEARIQRMCYLALQVILFPFKPPLYICYYTNSSFFSDLPWLYVCRR